MKDQVVRMGVQDRQLKEDLLKHYFAQRCFVQPEVAISHGRGVSEVPKQITDVDVFVLRANPGLRFEKLLGDCRTLKGQSPINRVSWLKGVMDLVHADAGIVLLKKELPITFDHKCAANDLGVTLLGETDFIRYDKAIVYPEGSERVPVTLREIMALTDLGGKYAPLGPLISYLYRDALWEKHFGSLIRHLIGNMRSVSGEFDPSKIEQLALVCDAAAIFSIGIAECAAEIFHLYIQPSDKTSLETSLRTAIWGGQEQYKFSEALRQKFTAITGDTNHSETAVDQSGTAGHLALPEWPQFIQLIRNVLDRPMAAFELPWILRRYALDIARGWEPLKFARHQDLLPIKFAMLTLSYLCRASNVPKEFETNYVSTLVGIQSRLVNRDERRPGDKASQNMPSDIRAEDNAANGQSEQQVPKGNLFSE